MSIEQPPFRWRSIALPAFLPTMLFAIGQGAMIPIIPIFANNLGASLAVAGLIAAVLTVGELVGDIPSGWLVARIGERPAMIGASLLSVVGLTLCVLAANPWLLGAGIFLLGLSLAVFALARHAFLTTFVPISHRARALSTLGGIFRAGFFIGPFLTAAGIQLTGTTASGFWIHLVCSLAAFVILITLRNPDKSFGTLRMVRAEDGRRMHEGEAFVRAESHGLLQTLRNAAPVLLRLGTGASLLSALRASRTVILPLWAVSIGLPGTSTAIIIGIAGAVDFALFYTGGQIMDRFGHIWTAVPPLIGLGLGHLVLSGTHDLAANASWFVAVAVFLALSNGISSGILMTLGSDLADKRNPAPFLGAWRFTVGVGRAAAPLAIAGITAAASLPIAAAVIGVVGLLGSGVLYRYMPRHEPSRRNG